jgi:hypothetical protein
MANDTVGPLFAAYKKLDETWQLKYWVTELQRYLLPIVLRRPSPTRNLQVTNLRPFCN